MTDKPFKITKETDFLNDKIYYAIRYLDSIYGFFRDDSFEKMSIEDFVAFLEAVMNDAHALGEKTENEKCQNKGNK